LLEEGLWKIMIAVQFAAGPNGDSTLIKYDFCEGFKRKECETISTKIVANIIQVPVLSSLASV
jgi:hypothetical protein